MTLTTIVLLESTSAYLVPSLPPTNSSFFKGSFSWLLPYLQLSVLWKGLDYGKVWTMERTAIPGQERWEGGCTDHLDRTWKEKHCSLSLLTLMALSETKSSGAWPHPGALTPHPSPLTALFCFVWSTSTALVIAAVSWVKFHFGF